MSQPTENSETSQHVFDQPKEHSLVPIVAPSHNQNQNTARQDTKTESADRNDKDGSDDAELSSSTWKGWAELENDPLIFTKLLKDWGVSEIKVEEVIPLEAIFDKPMNSVLGLIFLSRWSAPSTGEIADDPPEYLWFANQISTFSCATLALMNIINNVTNLDLGPQIRDFKQKTSQSSPKDRGIALDDFQFAKDIHNSFSRELDRLNVDLKLKEDYQAAKRKRARNKKKKRKGRRRIIDDEEDEMGFHFVAYVAVHGEVWRLDGTEVSPRKLGSFGDEDNWLLSTIADIQTQMDEPEANAMEFSLLSLTRESGPVIEPKDEVSVERMKEDWSPFFVQMLRLHAERGDLSELLE